MPLLSFLQTLDAWDKDLFLFLNRSLTNPFFDRLMPFVSDKWNFVLPLAVLFLYFFLTGGRRVRILLLSSLVLLLLADGSATAFTKVISRPRPCLALEHERLLFGCTSSSSFPSHHAANVFAVASFFVYTYRRTIIPLTLFALLVGYSRIYVGVHYPLDVLGGAVLGIGLGLLGGVLAARVALSCEKRFGASQFRWLPLGSWRSAPPGRNPFGAVSTRQAACWGLAPGTLVLFMIWDRETLDLVVRVGSAIGIGKALGELTFLGAGHLETSLAVLLLSSGSLLGIKRWKQAGRLSAYAIGLSGFTALALKFLLGRARPSLGLLPWTFIGPTFLPHYDSFPSGHATVPFAFATILSGLWPRGRWLIYSGAGAIALSRVYTGSHFPSDILAGALVGIFLSRRLAKRIPGGGMPAPRHIAPVLAKWEGTLEALRTVPHRLPQIPTIGLGFLLPILFFLSQARHRALEREELLLDLLGAAIIVAGWSLRTWAKNRSRQGNAGVDLTGAGSLVIPLGFGVMLESWWAFVLLCAAVAFAQALPARPGPLGRETERQETGSRTFFWREAKFLGLCVLAIGTIEVSEYLYRLYLSG